MPLHGAKLCDSIGERTAFGQAPRTRSGTSRWKCLSSACKNAGTGAVFLRAQPFFNLRPGQRLESGNAKCWSCREAEQICPMSPGLAHMGYRRKFEANRLLLDPAYCPIRPRPHETTRTSSRIFRREGCAPSRGRRLGQLIRLFDAGVLTDKAIHLVPRRQEMIPMSSGGCGCNQKRNGRLRISEQCMTLIPSVCARFVAGGCRGSTVDSTA